MKTLIIMPTYGRIPFLNRALASFLKQNYDDKTLVIINDDNNIELKCNYKNVVCIISGGNSDVFRMTEILERSLIYEGLKHYFKIQFPQKAGALKEFITNVLGKNDDIIYFKYEKIINKELGPVILGIELKNKNDINLLLNNMKNNNILYEKINNVI